jgi:Family of unknown function (DUF6325)
MPRHPARAFSRGIPIPHRAFLPDRLPAGRQNQLRAKETAMTLGPVEYVLIGFPGNRFKGEIIPALAQLVESGTIRIIDLVFVKKDADGAMEVFEYDALDEVTDVAEIEGEAGGLLSDEDIAFAAEALEPDTSAALLVWEDRWAAPLADALRNAGGVLIDGERIPHDIVEAALETLPAGA